MIFDTGKNNVQKSLLNNSQSFQIATGNKIFRILSDSIYVQKVDAVIREICSNAYDAHVEAKQKQQFIVKLPTELDLEFKVRDFGFGLSAEDMSMYTTYGESTKSSSNAYIGAFGIGAKSPFAYTNTFNVTSYQNGKGRAYSMFVEDGSPQMTLMGEFDTQEGSGLEVFFQVRIDDVKDFQRKAVKILSFMSDKAEIVNVSDTWREELNLEVKNYEWVDASYIGGGYQTSKVDIDTLFKGFRIIQGNVAYEMNMFEVREIFRLALGKDYDKTFRYLKSEFYLNGFIKVPNGTFVPHPSRERLTFDDLTKATLKNIFYKVFQYLVYDEIEAILNNVQSYYELYLALQNKSVIVRSSPRILDLSIDDQNTPASSKLMHPISNYEDWRKKEFSCITVTRQKDGQYHFKHTVQTMRFVFLENKIYFTNKYPLSRDYRYRIILAMRKADAERALLLEDEYYGDMFTLNDKTKFTTIQSLPKLTTAEWADFEKITQIRKAGVRVTKEQVSFLVIDRRYPQEVSLSQCSVDEVICFASEMPVMWVGSNRRYEFKFGKHLINLKVQNDCRIFFDNVEFYLKHAKDMTPEWKTGDSIHFGVVVLPEGHELRGLPELAEGLRSAILFEVREFLKEIIFEVEKPSRDFFVEKLIKHSAIFEGLLDGYECRENFDKWAASGYLIQTERLQKPRLPFFLYDDSDKEIFDAKRRWNTEQNYVRVDFQDFYYYIEKKYPIFGNCSYRGLTNSKLADDMIEYFEFKLGKGKSNHD
jgi:hypothetical protein